MRAATSARWSRGLPPGARLGRYTILERLAAGGMAELYLARQGGIDGFEKLVAIKRVLPHLAEDPDFIEMFRNEARIAATLAHPNIAQVFDVGIAEGEHFYALEYVHGRNLLQVLKRSEDRPLAIAEGLTIVAAVAGALHHAHEQRAPDGRPMGIVHRDVTPSNVMISFDGAVKLTDFGIARAAERTSTTRAGTIKGKAGYMSPEQARGEIIDRRSDVFSLGVMLYEVTTGARAFHAPNDYAVMGKIARGDYLAPRELDPNYPAALERIVVTALAVEPDDRYESAEALQQAIETFSHDHGARLSVLSLAEHMRALFGSPPYPSYDVDPVLEDFDTQPGPARNPRWIPLAVGTGLLAVGVGLGAVVFGRGSRGPEAAASPAARSASQDDAAPAPTIVPVPVEVSADGPPAVGAPQTDVESKTDPAPVEASEPEIEPEAQSESRPRRRSKSRRPRRRSRKTRPRPERASRTADREALYPPGYE